MSVNMELATLIEVENEFNIKTIHYLGFGYKGDCSDPELNGLYCRIVEYTYLTCPLKEAIYYGILKFEEDRQEGVTQYITNCNEKELDEYYRSAKTIFEDEINEETPCGKYFVVKRRREQICFMFI